jgi:uncharacterized membrane protein YbaN (DUF454 family)
MLPERMTNSPPDKKPSKRRVGAAIRRPTFFILGWICLMVGIVGLILPLLPGTVFLILSAACFTRSSPRFEKWLIAHPLFGPPILKWRKTGAIPTRAKWIACLSLAASWLFLLAGDAPWVAKAGCLAIFCGVAGYIVSRPGA